MYVLEYNMSIINNPVALNNLISTVHDALTAPVFTFEEYNCLIEENVDVAQEMADRRRKNALKLIAGAGLTVEGFLTIVEKDDRWWNAGWDCLYPGALATEAMAPTPTTNPYLSDMVREGKYCGPAREWSVMWSSFDNGDIVVVHNASGRRIKIKA